MCGFWLTLFAGVPPLHPVMEGTCVRVCVCPCVLSFKGVRLPAQN